VLASSQATTFQISRSVSESRHEGMPVILIPFLAIQNSCAGVKRCVMSSRYGGCGSRPPTHCCRATPAAPWQAAQCIRYAQKPATSCAELVHARGVIPSACRRTEWIIVSCVSQVVNLVCGCEAATL